MDHLKLVSVPTQSSMKNGSSGRVGGFQLLAPPGGLIAAVEKQQRPAFIFSPASEDKGNYSSITPGILKFYCLPGRAGGAPNYVLDSKLPLGFRASQ
jgi:hypothetical protein